MKNTKLTDTNYLYLSSAVACFEMSLIEGDKLEKMIDAKGFDESFAIAADAFSSHIEQKYGAENYENMLSAEILYAYEETEKLLLSAGGETGVLKPLKYAYDCQNLKSCIKCEALKISPNGMLFSCGNIPSEEVVTAVNSRNFSVFSPNICIAAPSAIEEFAASGDPQKIDIILDKAAFADMKEQSEKIGLAYLSQLCAAKADICNIMTFVRCIRSGSGRKLFEEMFLPGGTAALELEFFTSIFGDGEERLFSMLSNSLAYDKLTDSANKSLGEIEKLCDEIYLQTALGARTISFGAEKAVMYIIEKENEIRNIRIVLAGKKSGLSPENLRERIRYPR